MKSFISSDIALQAAVKAAQNYAEIVTDQDPDDGEHVVPGELRRFLGRLRLLHGVPFSYLVPDAELLPLESIRFFYLDRAWTDALVQGALSVGTVSSGGCFSCFDGIKQALDFVRREAGQIQLESDIRKLRQFQN